MEPPGSRDFLSNSQQWGEDPSEYSINSVEAVRETKVTQPTPPLEEEDPPDDLVEDPSSSFLEPSVRRYNYDASTTTPSQPSKQSQNDASVTSVSFRSLESSSISNNNHNHMQDETSHSIPQPPQQQPQQQHEVTFTENTFSGSRLSSATIYDSTLPMAFDNERFFDPDEGYASKLKEAADKLDGMIVDGWKEGNQETTFLGRLWRHVFAYFLLKTYDTINRLRLTRGMLDFLNFLGAYESFVLGGVIRYFDIPKSLRDPYPLYLALKSRNVCRILVGEVAHRWGWFFHVHQQLKWRRMFDLLGWLPWFGHYAALPSENYPSSRWYALYNLWDTFLELFRWHNDDVHNLTPELTGFEEAVRNHFGCHHGRAEFNKFRFEHLLSIDESVVRSFVANPTITLLNNGVEHVLISVSKHWQMLLNEENGNFAHQRMELLNPFEALRYHLPDVLLVLANLRGRCDWDSKVLAPLVHRLQSLDPARFYKNRTSSQDLESQPEVMVLGPCQAGKRLIQEIVAHIVTEVCAGINSRMEPLTVWLNAISHSFDLLQDETEAVRLFVNSVKTGVNLGYSLLKVVDWSVPTENVMKQAISAFIRVGSGGNDRIPDAVIGTAMRKLAPKDERTLKELIEKGFQKTSVTKLLLERSSELLVRELHRHRLDECLREASKGDPVEISFLEKTVWYWVDAGHGYEVCMLSRKLSKHLKFLQIDTNSPVLYEVDKITCLEYLPVAESITRAQKAYMTIEIDHCKKFSYNTFMEFGSGFSSNSLKTMMRRLLIVSQIFCSELDQARLKSLTEIRTSVSKRNRLSASRLVPHGSPQNTVVIGGGPTGLLCAIHCLQNVLLTGGNVRVYEGRDAYNQQAASFERAQIVRLDARQISMLRYHLGESFNQSVTVVQSDALLGSGFEDVFIPLRGESEAHLGNALPSQQFVEVVIKRLESMLLDEVINLRSKDLLQFYSDSMVQFDAEVGSFRKEGQALKPGDVVTDEATGEEMEIGDFIFESTLAPTEFTKGSNYHIFLPDERKPRVFNLEQMDDGADWYKFVEQLDEEEGREPVVVQGNFDELPPAYRTGYGRPEPTSVTIKRRGIQQEVSFKTLCERMYTLRFQKSHVVVALGKPKQSAKHFKVTPAEPYAVCCVEGLKVSGLMHRFGVPRFGKGVWDDYFEFRGRHNTRILGDFRKGIKVSSVIEKMAKKLDCDPHWKVERMFHEENPEQASMTVKRLREIAMISYRRERLQCRLFELGNNVYLGMEMPRELEAFNLTMNLKRLNRLWYEAAFEIIFTSHAIRRRERRRIPRFFLDDRSVTESLRNLKPQDGFRFGSEFVCRLVSLTSNGYAVIEPSDGVGRKDRILISSQIRVLQRQEAESCALGILRVDDIFTIVDYFEVVEKRRRSVIVRSSTGHIASLHVSLRIHLSSDLARGPSGYAESKVALASFDLAHYVSHRTLHLGKNKEEFITILIGDAQASPHFMRYSGLTGACINCATFNNMVGQSLSNVPFNQRVVRYSSETNWSNREVVRRGTGSNFGFDGFLRPGFNLNELVDFLFDKSCEARDIGIQAEPLLSRDWQMLVAAALVPRGMETENEFFLATLDKMKIALESKVFSLLCSAFKTQSETFLRSVSSYYVSKLTSKWTTKGGIHSQIVLSQLTPDERRRAKSIVSQCTPVAETLISCLYQAVEAKLLNCRHLADVFRQPKALDSREDFDYQKLVDSFGRKFGMWVSLATISSQFPYFEEKHTLAFLLMVVNIFLAVSIMSDPLRIRNRVFYARTQFLDELVALRKAVFSLRVGVESASSEPDPFVAAIHQSIVKFYDLCEFYGENDTVFMESAYKRFADSSKDEQNILVFMKQIASDFLISRCNGNSHIHEQLVRVYMELDDFLQARREEQKDVAGQEVGYAVSLLDEMNKILQHHDGPWALRLRGHFLIHHTLRRIGKVSKRTNSERLRRSVATLDQLHVVLKHRTLAGAVSLGSSFVSSDNDGIRFTAFVLTYLVSTVGTIAVVYFFGFIVGCLCRLHSIFSGRADRDQKVVCALVRLKLLATALFMVGCLVSIGSLSWSMLAKDEDRSTDSTRSISGPLAVASFAFHLVSIVGFLIAHYRTSYFLKPCMPEIVCKSLQHTISTFKKKFPDPIVNELQAVEIVKANWENVAINWFRQYGFENLFDRDRCFALLQYVQSNKPQPQALS